MAYTKLPQDQENYLSKDLSVHRYIGESSYFKYIAELTYDLVKDSPLKSLKAIDRLYIERVLAYNRTDYTFSVINKTDQYNAFLSVFIGLPIDIDKSPDQLREATNMQIGPEAVRFITGLTKGIKSEKIIFAPIVTVRENFKFKYLYMRPVIKDAVKVLSKEKKTLVAVVAQEDFDLFADLVKECCANGNIKANVRGQSIENVFNTAMCVAVIDFA